MTIVAGLLEFIKALPYLIRIYKHISFIFGDNSIKVLTDIDSLTKELVATQNPSLPIEEKRKLRREALLKSRELWTRVVDTNSL